jgi:hypothetical protein
MDNTIHATIKAMSEKERCERKVQKVSAAKRGL